MNPFSAAFQYNPSHDQPMWLPTGRDTNLTSHYRFYSEFQDVFEQQPQTYENYDNPSLDLYDIPHQHHFFPYMAQDPAYYQNRHWFQMPNRAPAFGVESEYGDEIVSKREEVYERQTNISSEAYKYQTAKQTSSQTNGNPALKGFMDLVNKASSFWMDKFNGPSTSTSGSKHPEHEQHDSQKGLFGKKDIKLTISYPCLISTNSLNNHRAAFEAQDDVASTYKSSSHKEKSVEDFLEKPTKVDRSIITKKKIKKVPRTTQEKWGSVHDQKLLDLVQQLGSSWNEIAESFKEDSITAKYVRERYRVLNKKGAKPKRQAFTREEDLEIAKYYKICEGNWESISKYFPTRRSAVIRNRFYSTIRGHLDEYLKEVESSGSEKKNIPTTPENDEQTSSTQNEDEKTQEEANMEVEGHKSQEDILDSYFNKEVLSESENLFDGEETFIETAVPQEAPKDQENTTNSLAMTRKVEDDAIGAIVWEDKPPKEAIEILNGRISLLTSLYNQTRIELVKLQTEADP